MNNIWGLIVSYVFIFLVIGISTVLQKKNVLKDEGARKFIHIGVAHWWIIAMVFFDNVYFAIIPPITFIILNYASYKMNLIKSMERGGKGNLGTVYFPISLLILVLLTFTDVIGASTYIGAIGILIMGYGDGLAAVIGKKYGKHPLAFGKSFEGSITMFIVSFLVTFVILIRYGSLASAVLVGLGVAIAGTVIELFTPKGLDNLTVPLGTAILAFILLLI
ncbi:MAG: diacylglycerol/polyprenol kinase family protein [Acholeplasmataceae bacterium]